MSTMRKIAFLVLTQYGALLLTALSSFVIIRLVFKHFGDNFNGVYITLLTIQNLVPIAISWITGSCQIQFSEAKASGSADETSTVYSQLIWTYLLYSIICSLIFCCIAWGTGRFIFTQSAMSTSDYPHIRNCAYWVAMSFPFNYYFSARVQYLDTNFKQSQANILRFLNQLATLCLTLLVLKFWKNIEAIFFANLLGTAIALTVMSFGFRNLLFPKLKLITKLGPTFWKTWRRFGKQYLALGSLTISKDYFEVLLIGSLLSTGFVSSYTFLTKPVILSLILCSRMAEMSAPYLALWYATKNESRLQAAVKIFKLSSELLGNLLFFSFVFFGRPFIEMWRGEQVSQSDYIILGLIAVPSSIQLLVRSLSNLEISTGNARSVNILLVAEMLVKLVVIVTCTKIWGFQGFVFGTCISTLFFTSFAISYLFKSLFGAGDVRRFLLYNFVHAFLAVGVCISLNRSEDLVSKALTGLLYLFLSSFFWYWINRETINIYALNISRRIAKSQKIRTVT